jgi:hypothetical protein
MKLKEDIYDDISSEEEIVIVKKPKKKVYVERQNAKPTKELPTPTPPPNQNKRMVYF